ncbi:hypothetical protein [Agromyces sp. SYSU T00266]|uniref:hypothetical protein n=1 Tax=Agromyces zhanjiangensis TaxID=3158562 RepID=UPI003399C285
MSQMDGRWHIESPSPMGKQESQLDVVTNGGTATGTITSMGGSTDILDATVDGDNLSFHIDVTTPMKMKINFNLTIEGDALSGKIKAGFFPSSKATGRRL